MLLLVFADWTVPRPRRLRCPTPPHARQLRGMSLFNLFSNLARHTSLSRFGSGSLSRSRTSLHPAHTPAHAPLQTSSSSTAASSATTTATRRNSTKSCSSAQPRADGTHAPTRNAFRTYGVLPDISADQQPRGRRVSDGNPLMLMSSSHSHHSSRLEACYRRTNPASPRIAIRAGSSFDLTVGVGKASPRVHEGRRQFSPSSKSLSLPPTTR